MLRDIIAYVHGVTRLLANLKTITVLVDVQIGKVIGTYTPPALMGGFA